MGDTTNWEFAAAVAGVSIGLGGLLLFTLIGTLGSWRTFDRAARSSTEAANASAAVQDLARYLAEREAAQRPVDLTEAVNHLTELRRQADALIQQQTRLHDAVRNLVEAGVLRSEAPGQSVRELDAAMERVEENLARVVAAVSALGHRQA